MSEATRMEWRDQRLALHGPLTFDTVPALELEGRRAFSQRGLPEVVDLADVRPADSAGFALVLEWLAQARSAGRSLEFRNPPAQLVTLAGLSSAQAILHWADDRHAALEEGGAGGGRPPPARGPGA